MDYEKGDFGESIFVVDKKKMKWEVTCHGRIVKITDEHVHFQDNEGKTYKIEKHEFQFTKEEFNNELQEIKTI